MQSRDFRVDCYAIATGELAKQALEVAVEARERQPGVEYLVGGDGWTEVISGLVAKLDGGRILGLGGDRHRDQTLVLAMSAGDFDERLLVAMDNHFELAVGKTLPALRALKPAGLAAKNIQNVHALFLPRRPGVEPSKGDTPARLKEVNG